MKIKICGLRELAAAKAAASGGADFIGFIFFAPSPRCIAPEKAAEIIAAIRKDFSPAIVGVFVDEEIAKLAETAALCQFDYIQLHGRESADYAREIRRVTGCRIIKAFRWGDDFSLEAANAYPADIILLDSFAKGLVGGTGVAFAWREAASVLTRLNKPYLVAGGIAADNAQLAAEIFAAPLFLGLDASGRLEDAPGQKNIGKIRELLNVVQAIR